jgi:hypothetical protein
LVVQLIDLNERIASENIDIYKWFWNEDRYCRISTPKSAESCRDILVRLLGEVLLTLGIESSLKGTWLPTTAPTFLVRCPKGKSCAN